MSSEDVRHEKVNSNIGSSAVRSSAILRKYNVVGGSFLNGTQDGCSFLRECFLEQRLKR